ncbi:hypothetical protein K2173_023867 [Erythroxylum novogranatense]|uniref:Transcription initiation factor TFIID subunit 1 n=1 Tax=Erythroxylum novogranatense TaxID=1862640 RepID=A0AAV8TPQ5_9ROSI|nr:hypothetical protein K2173_023867 [Erythroxylum novogranatense]
MGSYESGGASPDGRQEDDEEEYEEIGGGNRFLGFMFGNVDNSGDLDADYLDEDAKEHLSALADKLGPSLTDIDLSVKSPNTSADAAEQDYDEKAENAVDFLDFDEPYEGPEVQDATEEDYLLPKKEYFSSEVSVTTLEPSVSVFDDDNYDEEEEEDKEHPHLDEKLEVETTLSGEKSPEDGKALVSLEYESSDLDLEEFDEGEADAERSGPHECKGSLPLPILCVEDGLVILRFSEIFGIHEPLKRTEKRDHRYSIYKDKYKSMDFSEAVEDDEAVFLRASGQNFSSMSQAIERDISVFIDDGTEFTHFAPAQGPVQIHLQNEQQEKDACLSSEPLSKDVVANISAEFQSPFCSRFDLLDQQDWEESIIWGNSPNVGDSPVESYDSQGPALGASFMRETEQETGQQDFKSEISVEQDEKDHSFSLNSSSVLLESFGCRDSLEHERFPFSASSCHPQLLRLENQCEVDKCNNLDVRRENSGIELHQNDVIRRFNQLTLQNRDLLEGSWLNDILWESQKPNIKPKLILNLQDEQMLFEILDNKDSQHLRLHAGAMIITRPLKARASPEQLGGGYTSSWQFNIANDKFYINRKLSQQLQSNSNKRTAYGIKIHHAAPAIKLQIMKLKLSNKDLANFHRPKALWYPHDNEVAVKERGKLPTQGPMKIILKSLGGKGSKLHVDAEETVASVKVKASKKLDFKPSETVKIYYMGRELEEHKSLATQNVEPNSLLHLVRTKIDVLPRAQRIPGENKSLRPPGAFKKKSDLSVKDGHIFLMEYCEERPLLLSNAGMGANLCTYYQKSSPVDQNGIMLRNSNQDWGNFVVLEPTDKSPFLGDIKAGCTQSSLETNMYKAPVFPHKVQSTDYLLVRSAKGKLSIRRIDRIAVVGQQEPLMEVFSPGSKNLQTYMLNRLLVYVYRAFRAAEKRGLIPWIRADELSVQFPHVSETILRKKLKECASLRRDANGHILWSKKPDFIIPSEEELKKMVLPENVCACESMQAGLYRLKHLGITRLTLPTNVSTAMSQLPDEAIALAAASHIERELQITPWSLSSNFVACTSQDRENIERLEITGVGDPSGRGLGFSYVRAAPKAPVSNAMVKKKAAAGRGGSTVTGTDADLRRLSMEAAREVLLKFNVPEEQIAKQTRWHRIAMIRKLSSEQAASGVKVDPTTISKYARGQRMSFLQLQQQTREKCQEIWDRQVQSLSAVDGDEMESDSEPNSDLDSFAGDLENLLDAEECEGDEGDDESRHDKQDGVKGLKMRRRPSQTQAKEDIEDEEAEAAELCRLLMDDDETEQKKKKKAKSVGIKAGLLTGSKSKFVGQAERIKKTNKAQTNGSFILSENNIRDSKGVEALLGKKMSEKLKAIKKDITSSMPQIKTKVKILGDGLKTFKEKKSSRESFVCGACGQLGHMRTNKNCPKYGEEPESQSETVDLEKASGKSAVDPSIRTQLKLQKKKTKSLTKSEASEDEKSTLKTKALPMKFKCGSMEKFSDKPVDVVTQNSDIPISSDVQQSGADTQSGSKSVAKINKIKFSNKPKHEDATVELNKPSIVIRPPSDAERGQIEYHKPSIVIKPPVNTDKDHAESHKPSIVIRPPAEKEREQAHKKIVIKRSKEIVDLDQVSQDGTPGFEYRKTKKIVELSGYGNYDKQKNAHFTGESAKHTRDERRFWEEEEKRRTVERSRESRVRRIREEEIRLVEEQGIAELRRYEEVIRREREEEQQKANKKKKKKPEISDDFSEDYRARRNDGRMAKRDRAAKRRPVTEIGRYSSAYAPVTKRRRGGEVGLANILERIVDTLRDRLDLSYLFLKPVSKKEAPDYLDIIKRPMDLSTIRDKVRHMEYKNRHDFRHDVWQITYNAHLYNDGQNPGIPPLADQLLELCDYMLEENTHSLDEAEAGIDL